MPPVRDVSGIAAVASIRRRIVSAPPLAPPNPEPRTLLFRLHLPRLRSPFPLFTCCAFLLFFLFFLFFGSVFEARLLTRMWRARLCPMRTVRVVPIFLRSQIHKRRPAGKRRCWRLRSASPAVCRASAHCSCLHCTCAKVPAASRRRTAVPCCSATVAPPSRTHWLRDYRTGAAIRRRSDVAGARMAMLSTPGAACPGALRVCF